MIVVYCTNGFELSMRWLVTIISLTQRTNHVCVLCNAWSKIILKVLSLWSRNIVLWVLIILVDWLWRQVLRKIERILKIITRTSITSRILLRIRCAENWLITQLIFDINIGLALWLVFFLSLHLYVQINGRLEYRVIVINHAYGVARAASVPRIQRFTDRMLIRKLFDSSFDNFFFLRIAQLVNACRDMLLVIEVLAPFSVLWVIASRGPTLLMSSFLLFLKVFLLNLALLLLIFSLVLRRWLSVKDTTKVCVIYNFNIIIQIVLISCLN